MNEIKIEILRDTPMHNQGALISFQEFRDIYGILFEDITNEAINDYGTGAGSKLMWFKVLDTPKYKIGDWVWNNKTQRAYVAVEYSNSMDKSWYPNHTSIDAVNNNPEIWTRMATMEEIERHLLNPFCNGNVLIGRLHAYYFNNVWSELKGIDELIYHYLKLTKNLPNIYYPIRSDATEHDYKFSTVLNGLKIGCQIFDHKDIIKIAKIRKLI